MRVHARVHTHVQCVCTRVHARVHTRTQLRAATGPLFNAAATWVVAQGSMSLCVVLVTVALIQTVGSQAAHKREYMNYQKISANSSPSGAIEVVCYDRGIYWVCPNPLDKKRAAGNLETYNQGFFIAMKTIRISRAVFEDPDMWN